MKYIKKEKEKEKKKSSFEQRNNIIERNWNGGEITLAAWNIKTSKMGSVV